MSDITYKDQKRSATEWARSVNMKPQVLIGRLRRGWDFEKALLTPVAPPLGGGDNPICKSRAERELDETPFNILPKEFQVLIKSFGYKGTRYGDFVRSMYRKTFDKWYLQIYVPAQTKT